MNNYSLKKERKFFFQLLKKGIFSLFFILFFFSCKNDLEKIYELESENLPDVIIKEPTILRSVSGVVDVKIEAPLVKQFMSDPTITEFPEGVLLFFYDGNRNIESTLSAKYAISNDDEKTMEARNNVIIIDYEKRDTTYTEQIIWDQNIHKIYSKKPVKRVNGDEVTYGDGFEMDEKTKIPTITNPRGVMEWEE